MTPSLSVGADVRRAYILLLLLCVPALWAAISVSGTPGRVYASMELTAHVCEILTDCGTGQHLTWTPLYESHPNVTNCDDSSYYGNCSVTTATECSSAVGDCPPTEDCLSKPSDTPSLGRCNLMPGVYKMFLSANGLLDNNSCYASLAVANTTALWPSTSNMMSKIQIWLARNTYSGTPSLLGADAGIVTVTEQSWVEARFAAGCADLTSFDGGTWVVERIGNYNP